MSDEVWNDGIDDDVFDEEWDEDTDDEGCPLCGSDNLILEGRCITCMDCGWSKCSL